LQSFTVDVAPQDWETKVLKSFMAGDRITDIPASRKKRVVVLKWLVRRFETDRDYPEKELNALIKRHHPDTATLRREFIGYGLMMRENGLYRRLPESEWREEATNFN
jgi:hypothetical protein